MQYLDNENIKLSYNQMFSNFNDTQRELNYAGTISVFHFFFMSKMLSSFIKLIVRLQISSWKDCFIVTRNVFLCLKGWAALRSYCRFTWLPGLTLVGCLMTSLHLFDDAKSFSSWWPFNRNKHFQNIFCSFKGKNGSMWSLALHDHSYLLQQLFATSRSTLFDIGQKHCPTS